MPRVNSARIGVILVNFNGYLDTCACIESVFASSYKNIEVYVVDNASSDGLAENLLEVFPQRVTVIALPDNIGFGAANNVGMHRAFTDGCDAVLLLNNDTVVDERMIELLVESAEERYVTVPLMLYYDDPSLIWYGGGCFDRFGLPRHLHYRDCLSEVGLTKEPAEFVTGCCFLMYRHVFETVGDFDEKYFLYWEDSDLSIRMKRLGVKALFCPEAVLYHKVSSSTGGELSPTSYYYASRNRLYAIKKFRLGMGTRVWVYMSLLKGILSKDERFKYTMKSYRDYRRGNMGKQF